MLNILMYALCYIGAVYVLMAVPCLLWSSYGRLRFGERSLPVIFFVTAPLTWPLFALGMAADGWFWLRDRVLKLTGRN